MTVPYRRQLKLGMIGGDVRALQRALRAADCRTGQATGEFKRYTRRNVRLFQSRHGLSVDGVVGQATWAKLQPYFDAYSAWLVQHTNIPTPVTTKIDHFVKIAWRYYDARPLRYVQQRPMRGTGPLPNIDRFLDCSEYVYVCAKNAGLPDPSGFGYNGAGNTDSFLNHMPHASGPERGGLAFYSNPSHVVIIVGQGRNHGWMVLSNGSDLGPRFLPLGYRPPSAYRTFRGLR